MKSKFLLTLLMLCVVCVSVSGVYATWKYTQNKIEDKQNQISLGVDEFVFTPEEVLPDEEFDQLGENHVELINNILNEVRYGLNSTQKDIIHKYLVNVGDIIYCDQKVEGGNLKHLMLDGANVEHLLFLIVKVSDSEYHTYTYTENDIDKAILGTRITVYKTVMEKDANGVWDATRSYVGTAVVIDPPNVGEAIDYTTWQR